MAPCASRVTSASPTRRPWGVRYDTRRGAGVAEPLVAVVPEPGATTPPVLKLNDGILTECTLWLTLATIDPTMTSTNTTEPSLHPARTPGL